MRRSLLTFLGLGALLIVGATRANGLQVAPTSLGLSANTPAAELWLSHTQQGDLSQPLQAQVRVFQWTQVDGQDRLVPTDALMATPPFITLTTRAPQLVRVMPAPGVQVASATTETSYRLIVDELPSATVGDKGGLAFVMHYSIPVFVAPVHPAVAFHAQDLTFAWTRSGNKTQLKVTNPSSFHAQLVQVQVQDGPHAGKTLEPGLLGYVLPGKTMAFDVPLPWNDRDRTHQLRLRINGQEEHVIVH